MKQMSYYHLLDTAGRGCETEHQVGENFSLKIVYITMNIQTYL